MTEARAQLPKKPPFIGSAQEGLPERQWLMSLKDLEEYLAQHGAQRVPLTTDQVFASQDLMYLNGSLLHLAMPQLIEVIRTVERAHGIGAKP